MTTTQTTTQEPSTPIAVTAPVTISAEQNRIEQIKSMASHVPSIQAIAQEAIVAGTPFDDFRQQALSVVRASRAIGPAPTGGGRSSDDRQTIKAFLFIQCGKAALAEQECGTAAVSAARSIKAKSLEDLRDMIRASADSTISMPNIIPEVINSVVSQARVEMVSGIKSFATIRSATDFNVQKEIQPAGIAELEKLGASGEIKHSPLLEEAMYQWALDQYARMVSITRKDIINALAGWLDQLSMQFATASATAENNLYYKTILAYAGFTVGNKNFFDGASSALSIDSLTTAATMLRKQVDSRGDCLNFAPHSLVVPPELEATGRQVLNSLEIITKGNTDTVLPNGNPAQGLVKNLVVEPRLSNTKFVGNSTKAWYLNAGPVSSAFIVGYLNGQENPNIEVSDQDFNKLGMQMRAVLDFGCAMGEPKAWVKANGEV